MSMLSLSRCLSFSSRVINHPYHIINHSIPHKISVAASTTLCKSSQNDNQLNPDVEVAVFRFTLGIPGFDDALIPRVVGIVSSALLLINHFVSPQPVSDPQIRIEVLGGVLAAVAVTAPSIQQRLDELKPGRGRKAAVNSVKGGSNVFILDKESIPNENYQLDLAWASAALLKNTNTCGLLIIMNDRMVLCRGILGDASSSASSFVDIMARLTKQQIDTKTTTPATLLFEDRMSIAKAGLEGCAIIPEGANTVAIIPIQPLPGDETTDRDSSNKDRHVNAIVLVSERERALSSKETAWARGVASRLAKNMC